MMLELCIALIIVVAILLLAVLAAVSAFSESRNRSCGLLVFTLNLKSPLTRRMVACAPLISVA